MFPEAVSRTALLTAAARAAESNHPHPLFVDPYAARLAGTDGEELHAKGFNPDVRTTVLAIRTRVFDDAIVAAIAAGATQVVMPAAGMDTRAFRLDLPAHLRWFEIDHAAVLDYKSSRLAGATPRVARTVVPFDLREPGVGQALASAGFDASAISVVVVEGLLMYLPPPAVQPLLQAFAAIVPPGSTLLADIPNVAAIDPSGLMGVHVARLAAMGSPWQFATDDPASVLAAAGWQIDDLLYAGHPRAWPERLPFKVPEPPAPGHPFTWLVNASRRTV